MPPRGRAGDGGSRNRGAARTGGALAPSARRKDLRPPVQADPAQEAGALQAACAALGEVMRKYPRASSGVKAAVDREQKRVKC